MVNNQLLRFWPLDLEGKSLEQAYSLDRGRASCEVLLKKKHSCLFQESNPIKALS
jgi:hypothetical protein